MKKKLLLITIPIIAVLLAAIGVLTYILVASPSPNGMYLEHIRMAQKSLQEGDADQAILYYQSAIAEDDMQDEPYIALASIFYEHKNDLKKALDTLFEGYGKTRSDKLYEVLQKYLELSENGELTSADQDDGEHKKGEINSSYISTFSSYTYQSYSEKFTVDSEQNDNDAYKVRYSEFNAEFEYRNSAEQPRILDPASGKPTPNSRPAEIRFDTLDSLIYGVKQGVTVDDLSAGGANYAMVNEPGNGFSTKYISFVSGSCKCYIECDDNGVINNVNGVNKIVPPMSQEDETKAKLVGQVVNADNNQLIKNVTVNIRKGKGAKDGAAAFTLSAPDGEFSIELEPGSYTVETIADGYITDYYDCSLPEAGETVTQSFVMSPKLQQNQMRFVVEWTNTQYDLYIHIKGRSSNNESIQYWEYGSSSGNVSDNLGGFDSGSQNGHRYTSATITDSRGNYEFHVHGGKDQYSKDSLYNANVVVKIYKDNVSSPMIVNLPASIPLDYWQVCTVHDGEIKLID